MVVPEQKLLLPDTVDSILVGNINRKFFHYLYQESPYSCGQEELMRNVWGEKNSSIKQSRSAPRPREVLHELRKSLRLHQLPFAIYSIEGHKALVMTDRPLENGSLFLIGQDQDFCSGLETEWQEPARRMFSLAVDGQKLKSLLSQTEKNLAKMFLTMPDKLWSREEMIALIWPLNGSNIDPVVDIYNREALWVTLARTKQKLIQGNCGVTIANKIGRGYFLQKT